MKEKSFDCHESHTQLSKDNNKRKEARFASRNGHCSKTSATLQWFLVNDQRDAQFFSMYLFLFLTLCIFRAHRAHHQEWQIVSMQPLVAVTLFRWLCRVHVGSVNFRRAHDTATDSYQRLHWHNLSLLMMSTMCSKNAEC